MRLTEYSVRMGFRIFVVGLLVAPAMISGGPIAFGSPSGTPLPTPYQTMRGDMNCDGNILPGDSLDVLVYKAGIPVAHLSCIPLGGYGVTVGGGGPYLWGDIDCDQDIDLDDVISHLAAQASSPVENSRGCGPYNNLGDVVHYPYP